MPRYREHPLIVKFAMLCPGISQNTKHHQLTLYKGQVWREKSYLELCNHNVLNIAYDPYDPISTENTTIEENGELYVPPLPGGGFINDSSMIPSDSEIIQSFAELTNITNITFHSFDSYKDFLEDITYQIMVGNSIRNAFLHNEQSVPPNSYDQFFIWTKEDFEMLINKIIRFKLIKVEERQRES